MEVIIASFQDAITTVDVLTASNNDVQLVVTRTVHFTRLKWSSRFQRISILYTRRQLLVLETSLTCLPPEIYQSIALVQSFPRRARAKIARIVNKVREQTKHNKPRLVVRNRATQNVSREFGKSPC